MSGNDYNVAIKPIDIFYVLDEMAVHKLDTTKLLFNFNTYIPPLTNNLPVLNPLEILSNMMKGIHKQLSSVRYALSPAQIQLAPVTLPPAETLLETESIDAGQAFDKIMEYVFKDEGGYVNHPKDPGGATNMGVTQSTYDWYCKLNNISSKNVKNLTREEAKQVYYQLFWEKSGAKEIAEKGDAKLAYVVFDTAIHSGIGRAKKLLAKSNGDADTMLENRLEWLHGLKNWKTFGKGWTARIDKIESRIDNFDTASKEYLA